LRAISLAQSSSLPFFFVGFFASTGSTSGMLSLSSGFFGCGAASNHAEWSPSSTGRYVAFQMAEVAIPRQMFQEILRLIAELRPQPPPAPA
jgi:hypothetical protein